MTIMFTFGAGTHADNALGVVTQCYKTRSLAGFWYQGVMIFTLPIYWLISPIFRPKMISLFLKKTECLGYWGRKPSEVLGALI